MKRILLSLLLFCLPLAALADGMVIPAVAFPAKVTIPDQRALIYFTNGTERLVIETRFTGAGTNFAWVVPFPSQPVIEPATTGLFPTLQYLFRPQIVHNVPRYYMGIFFGVGLIYLLWRTAKSVWDAFIIAIMVLVLAAWLLPSLSAGTSAAMASGSSSQFVSVLDRKLVGIFETTTISSSDPKALESWLRENGYFLATNASPVIASYVRDGWVFVASKIRRDKPDAETSTPHPLSFTFKTDRPVYPMRLTGLDSPSLLVDLYVFGDGRFTAPHFKVESCIRPNLVHPLLRQWVGNSSTATKLTANLSPADMRKDVWLQPSAFFTEQKNRQFSRDGALTIALNWGAGCFTAGLLAAGFCVFVRQTFKAKLPRFTVIIFLASSILAGLVYLSLPKIEVRLVKGGYLQSRIQMKQEQLVIRMALDDFDWHTVAEARAGLQAFIANPTNAAYYGLKNWDNGFVGGELREEDSPGNYLLRETSQQLQIIGINRDGSEDVLDNVDLPVRH
ncbi:MAG: DUF2330 domain-containing protein [Limisphaerales bacterium]